MTQPGELQAPMLLFIPIDGPSFMPWCMPAIETRAQHGAVRMTILCASYCNVHQGPFRTCVRCGSRGCQRRCACVFTRYGSPDTEMVAMCGAVSVRGGADRGGLFWPIRAVPVPAAVCGAITKAIAETEDIGGRTQPHLGDCQLNAHDLVLIAFRARRRGR